MKEKKRYQGHQEVGRCLDNFQGSKPTLKKAEREAIRSLKDDNDLVVIRADKGNATVVMNREDYVGKMDELLKGEDYVRIRKNPTSVVEKKVKDTLSKIEKNGIPPTRLKKRLTPQQSKCPQMYGLPKVHKVGIPLRPIVSAIGSPTYQLAKQLCRILSPIVGKSNSYIRNSSHFVEKISEIQLQEF